MLNFFSMGPALWPICLRSLHSNNQPASDKSGRSQKYCEKDVNSHVHPTKNYSKCSSRTVGTSVSDDITERHSNSSWHFVNLNSDISCVLRSVNGLYWASVKLFLRWQPSPKPQNATAKIYLDKIMWIRESYMNAHDATSGVALQKRYAKIRRS